MKMKQQEKIISIMTAIFLLIVVVVIVIVCGVYTNWFRSKFEFIYLESNGERLSQNDIYVLGDAKFAVKQFGFNNDYSLSVIAVSDEDFLFSVDGVYKNYLGDIRGKDLIAAFDIEQTGSSFLFHASKVSVLNMLNSVYPGQKVELVSDVEQPLLYKLLVSSGKHSFELTFQCKSHVTDIEVDPDHVLA